MSKSNEGVLKIPLDSSLFARNPIMKTNVDKIHWLGITARCTNLGPLVTMLIKSYYNE
jgi:hypothetical protein